MIARSSLLVIAFVISLTTIVAASPWPGVEKIAPDTVDAYTTSIESSSAVTDNYYSGTENGQFDNSNDLNVLAQHGELAAVISLTELLKSQDANDSQLCNAAQSNIRAFYQAGVTIRQNNLLLAKSNPQGIRSLTHLMQQQVQHIGQINNMTCKADNDIPILKSLQESLCRDLLGDQTVSTECSH